MDSRRKLDADGYIIGRRKYLLYKRADSEGKSGQSANFSGKEPGKADPIRTGMETGERSQYNYTWKQMV